MAILPGNGDGTFGASIPVTGPPAPQVTTVIRDALTSDLNGDGNRDLVLMTGRTVTVYPGNGDFTFAPPIILALSSMTSEAAQNGITGDFDGDGRPDLAIVNDLYYVDLFLNRGGFLFTPAPINVGCAFQWSITAGDFNRDGKLDLVLTCGDRATVWSAGKFFLLSGNGDGTFQAPMTVGTTTRRPVFTVVSSVGQRDDRTRSRQRRICHSGDVPPGEQTVRFGRSRRHIHERSQRAQDVRHERRWPHGPDCIAGCDPVHAPATANRLPTLTMSSIWVVPITDSASPLCSTNRTMIGSTSSGATDCEFRSSAQGP